MDNHIISFDPHNFIDRCFDEMSRLGYSRRESQVKMAHGMIDGFLSGKTPFVEAPTGTGKSFVAAFVGAALSIYLEINKDNDTSEKYQTYISTSTRLLQDQYKRDIPVISRIIKAAAERCGVSSFIGGNVISVIKGKQAYLCHQRLATVEGIPEEDLHYIDEIKSLVQQGWGGEFDTLPESVDIPARIKKAIHVEETEGCRKCPASSRCAYVHSRTSMKDSVLIVGNHAFVFVNKKLSESPMVSVIFDEGHDVADVARGTGASKVNIEHLFEISKIGIAASSWGKKVLDVIERLRKKDIGISEASLFDEEDIQNLSMRAKALGSITRNLMSILKTNDDIDLSNNDDAERIIDIFRKGMTDENGELIDQTPGDFVKRILRSPVVNSLSYAFVSRVRIEDESAIGLPPVLFIPETGTALSSDFFGQARNQNSLLDEGYRKIDEDILILEGQNVENKNERTIAGHLYELGVRVVVKTPGISEELKGVNYKANVMWKDEPENLNGVIKDFCHDNSNKEEPPISRRLFMERIGTKKIPMMTSTPVVASVTFSKFMSGKHVALMSATLKTLPGNDARAFVGVASELGVPEHNVHPVVVPSPFDYGRQVEFVASTNMKAAPKGDKHNPVYWENLWAMVREYIYPLVKDGKGSLIVFSNRREMDRFVQEAESDNVLSGNMVIQRYGVGVQSLVNEHKNRIDNGRGSVIVGVRSVSTGLDLPGDYCRGVVLARLPFSSSTSPEAKLREEYLKEKVGENNYFARVVLPEVIFRVKQTCGRLIRKEGDMATRTGDYGGIYVPDPRLTGSGWGKKYIAKVLSEDGYVIKRWESDGNIASTSKRTYSQSQKARFTNEMIDQLWDLVP